jgi:hypothetical protein
MSIDQFRALTGQRESIVDLLALPAGILDAVLAPPERW